MFPLVPCFGLWFVVCILFGETAVTARVSGCAITRLVIINLSTGSGVHFSTGETYEKASSSKFRLPDKAHQQ